MDDTRAKFEGAQELFGNLVSGLRDLTWENVPEPARNFIYANSCITAAQIVLVLLLFCPSLIALPALAYMGFSSTGPIAGSAAAGYQSANGATWIFSYLQSAAMHGYGTAAINGFVQGFSGISAGIAEILRRR